MTFVRPSYPIDFGGLPDIPSPLRPGGTSPSPQPLFEAVKENPEPVHSGVIFIATRLVPPPARITARAIFEVGHYAGHLLWDRATQWFPSDKSSESSSLSYQQNGGSGGTAPSRRFKNIDAIPGGSRVTKPTWKTTSKHAYGGTKSGYHYCKKGWFLVRVGDTNMCWKPPRKKKS